MRMCPKCGSKELLPVVFGKKSDHSKIIQKKIDDGEYILVRRPGVSYSYIACKSCGFKWPLGRLPIKYLKKVRFKREEFGTNGIKSGDRIIEIFPDGKVRYYAHAGFDTKASVSVSGKVTKKSVNELFKKLDEIKNGLFTNSLNTDYDMNHILQMLYTDNDKITIDGDLPDGTIYNSIMGVAAEIPEIKKELDLSFKDAEAPEKNSHEDSEDGNDDALRKDEDDGFLYLKGRGAEAKGRFAENGFLVLAGSKIALDETKSCLKSVHEEREKYFADGTFKNGKLTKDLLFKGVARACSVITGGIGDGKSYWKYINGESINSRDTRHTLELLDEEDFDFKSFEDAKNEIFSGISMYVRDVNLNDSCAGKYVPDTILMERGFTDASARVMGMKTTHRFTILSNHMADLSDVEHGTDWGLFVANHHAYFKVLDIYEYQGKTQILLLHLPDDERWKLFRPFTTSEEEQLIEDSRKCFKNKCNQEVIPELAAQDWLDRCSNPIGMDMDGSLFDSKEPIKYSDKGVLELDYYITIRIIMQKLTDDNESNIEWLKKAMERYKDHPRGSEIIKACARKLYDLMPEDQRRKLDGIAEEERNALNTRINEIRNLLIDKKAEQAKPLMDALAEEADENPMFREDEVSRFFRFREWFEECFYTHMYDPKKELRRAEYPYDEIYAMQGSMYIDLGDLDKARECLKKALAWNPVNTQISFEYAETFKLSGEMETFFEESKKIQKYSLHNTDVARFLRNAGFYFTETGKYAEAMKCYMRSLFYDHDSKTAENEINYLYEIYKEEIKLPDAEECRAFEQKYGFPLGADNDLLGMMYGYGKHFMDIEENEGAAYCFGLLYELTDDPDIKKILDQLDADTDEKES